MKILSICHDHPSLTPGGTEIVARDLVRHLDRLPGVTARFLAVSTALTRPEAAAGSVEWLGEDMLLRTGGYDAFSMTRHDGPDWTAALAGVIGALAPDLVHLHGLDRIGASVVTFLRCRFPRLRLVLTLHDYQILCPAEGLMLRTADGAPCQAPDPIACQQCFPRIEAWRHALRADHLRRVLGQIDAFIAPSAFLRQRFLDWGLPEGRVHLVRNAVAPPSGGDGDSSADDSGSGSGAGWTLAPDRLPNRFAYLGNLAPHKGVRVLLKAGELLRDDPAGIRISVHGDLVHPSEAARAEIRRAFDAAWPVVQHPGRYGREDVAGILAAADWVVLPALWPENAPLSVLEALAAGRPVICTPVGGLPELVRDGVNGLHVPRGDVHGLADTLRRAATDPGLWHRLAAGTRSRPRHEAHVEAHRILFQGLLRKVPA